MDRTQELRLCDLKIEESLTPASSVGLPLPPLPTSSGAQPPPLPLPTPVGEHSSVTDPQPALKAGALDSSFAPKSTQAFRRVWLEDLRPKPLAWIDACRRTLGRLVARGEKRPGVEGVQAHLLTTTLGVRAKAAAQRIVVLWQAMVAVAGPWSRRMWQHIVRAAAVAWAALRREGGALGVRLARAWHAFRAEPAADQAQCSAAGDAALIRLQRWEEPVRVRQVSGDEAATIAGAAIEELARAGKVAASGRLSVVYAAESKDGRPIGFLVHSG